MKYLYIIIFCIISIDPVWAQQELTLHLMKDVYQSNYTNPALRGRTRGNISLLSSVQVNVRNTGFTYDQLITQSIRQEGDKKILSYEDMYANLNLKGKDYLHFETSIDALVVAFKVGKNRFSLNATEHIQGRFGYGNGLFQLLAEGNTPGETITMDGYKLNGTHYREFGIGYNRDFLENKLVVGTRIKLIHGLSNVKTEKLDARFTTGTEDELYEITAAADVMIRTSGTSLGNEDLLNAYLLNTKNAGFGIDLGATYQFDDKLSFAASIINLGMINWKTDVRSYSFKGTFVFSGIENDSLFLGSGFNFEPSELMDSLKNAFEVQEDSISAYRSGLPGQTYLTTYYKVGQYTTASATLYADFIASGFHPAMSLGIQQQVGRWFNVTGTYSLLGRSFNNLGLGFSIKSGGFQLYAATDNVFSVVFPTAIKTANIRTGINIVF